MTPKIVVPASKTGKGGSRLMHRLATARPVPRKTGHFGTQFGGYLGDWQ
jgi:hypothetical protein